MRLSRLTEAGLSWSLAKGAPHIKICTVDSAAYPRTIQVRARAGPPLHLPGEPRSPALTLSTLKSRGRSPPQSRFPDRHFAGFPRVCALCIRISGTCADGQSAYPGEPGTMTVRKL